MNYLNNRCRLWSLFVCYIILCFGQIKSFAQCNTACSSPMDWEITNTLITTPSPTNDDFSLTVSHSSPLSFAENCWPYTNPYADPASSSNPTYRIQILKSNGSSTAYTSYTGFYCNTSDMNYTGPVTGGDLIVNETFIETNPNGTVFNKNNLAGGTYLYCIRLGTDKSHSKYKVGSFTIAINNDFYISNASLSNTSVAAGASVTANCRQNYSGNSTSTVVSTMHYVLSSNTTFGDMDDVYLTDDISGLHSGNLYSQESATLHVPSGTVAGSYYILFVADAPQNFAESNEDNNIQAVPITVQNVPPTPSNVQATDDLCDKIRVTWDASFSALGYEILDETNAVIVTGITNTYYDITGVPAGVVKTYRVRAANMVGSSGYGYDTGYRPNPLNAVFPVVTATDGEYPDKVRISWSWDANTGISSNDVEEYYIFRNGAQIDAVISGTSTYFDDFMAPTTGVEYQVRAKNDCGTSLPGYDPVGYRCQNYAFQLEDFKEQSTLLVKTESKYFEATIKLTGTVSFTGSVALSLHKKDGTFITDFEQRGGITLSPNQTITLRSDQNPVKSASGKYDVLVKYQEPDAFGNCAGWKTIYSKEIQIVGKVTNASLPHETNGDPINMLTGEFLWGHNDFLIKTIEGTIPFQRTYKSRADHKSGFGHKWTHNFNVYLEIESDLWTLHKSDGNKMYFVPDGSGGSQARPLFSTDTLYVQSFVYHLKKKDGTTYKFNHLGNLLEIKFPSGNAFYFGYGTASNGDNRLENIIFPQGRNLTLVYDSFDRIIQVKDNAGRNTFYQYNSNDYLTQATNVRGGHVRYYYDANARLVAIKDARGNTSVFNTYNSDGQVVQQLNAYNKMSAIAYNNPVENATTFTNALGYKTIYYHDAYYRLTKVENHLGKSRDITYDGFSYRPKIISDENGDSTRFSYDIQGNIIQIKNALGGIVDITYNNANYPKSFINSLGRTVQVTYDYRNKPTQIDFPNTSNIKINYFGNGLPSSITNQNNQTYSFLYNNFGDIQEVDTPTGSYFMQYDNAGKLTSIRDRNSKTTFIETDNYGNVTKITDPLNRSIQRIFNENGFLTEQRDKNGKSTFFEYDKRNLLTKIIDANTNETLFDYDDEGRLITITDAENHQMVYGYDELNRLTNIANHLGITTQTFGYDDAGNRIWVKDANGKGNYFTYNKLRQLLTITDELNHTDSLTYNTLGQLITVKNTKEQTTSFSYDVMGWLKTVTDPMNGVVTYTRDKLGNITNINNANGKNTQIIYNSQNLPSLVKYPGTSTYQRSFVYDNEGFLKSYTDEDNITATLTRDDNHFVNNIAYSNGKNESFARDANGWLTSATNTQGTITFTRDNVGNVTNINDVFTQDIAYTYDKVYNRTSVTYPGGTIAAPHTATTTYNTLNLPTQTTDWLGNYTKRFYNDNYQLDSIYNSNGSSTKITYDDLQRVTRYVNREANDTIINQHQLTYDKNNRIIKDESTLPAQITLATKLETYAREDDGRLNRAGTKVYSQNKRGARTATTGTSSESFTWGETDLLTSYTKNDVTTNNYFDAFGNRVKKEEAGDQTRYLLDLNSGLPQVLEEQDNAGNTKASYIYSPNALAWRLDENNKPSFYAYSFNGHTLGLTNEAGLLTDKYAYDLFGDHAKHVGSSPQPFTYLGKFGVMEEAKGFYHIRARFYDASIGAFISKDSYPPNAANTQSLNRYHYGFNDPLTFVDVDGFKAKRAKQGASSASYEKGAIVRVAKQLKQAGYKPEDIIDTKEMFALISDRGGIDDPFLLEQIGLDIVLGKAFIRIASGVRRGLSFANTRTKNSIDKGFGVSKTLLEGGKKILKPKLGKKLDFLFGKATGNKNNIQRSTTMLRQLNSIGIFDNDTGRKLLKNHLVKVLNNSKNVLAVQTNGRLVRESLLKGPNGLLKVQSIWEGDRLITVILFGK